VDKAVESGKLANVPVIVDFGEHTPANSIESLFMEHFRPGDIFTHTFSEINGGRESIVDEKSRKVKPFVFAALKKRYYFRCRPWCRSIQFQSGNSGHEAGLHAKYN